MSVLLSATVERCFVSRMRDFSLVIYICSSVSIANLHWQFFTGLFFTGLFLSAMFHVSNFIGYILLPFLSVIFHSPLCITYFSSPIFTQTMEANKAKKVVNEEDSWIFSKSLNSGASLACNLRTLVYLWQMRNFKLKNPADGSHWISQSVRIIAPVTFADISLYIK